MSHDTDTPEYLYLIALGSNRRHKYYGKPQNVIIAALERLERKNISVYDHSNIMETAAIGPSMRNYANSAALILTSYRPPTLLNSLKTIEAEFGKRRGQRWSARTLDLDIILWSEGIWASEDLSIPHSHYHKRDFVLKPAAQIAGKWRDPIYNLNINHILFRKCAPKRVDRSTSCL